MANNKSNKTAGGIAISVVLALAVCAAALAGLYIAREISGRDLYSMLTNRHSAETVQPEQETEPEVEHFEGIDNDRTYFRDENGTYIPEYEELEENTLDPDLFYTQDGRIYYNSENARYGIDISSHQGEVDWKKVKEQGIDFVILRAGYRGYGQAGSLNEDEMFLQNAQGALEAGLDIGAYIFSQAITEQEAVEEAELILELTKDMEVKYPIVFDWEEIEYDTARTDDITSDQMTAFAKAFCERVEQSGHHSAVYLNVDQGYMKYDLEALDAYDLWIASYKEKPDFYYDFDMWQYTSDGLMEGVSGNTDFNISFKTYDE